MVMGLCADGEMFSHVSSAFTTRSARKPCRAVNSGQNMANLCTFSATESVIRPDSLSFEVPTRSAPACRPRNPSTQCHPSHVSGSLLRTRTASISSLLVNGKHALENVSARPARASSSSSVRSWCPCCQFLVFFRLRYKLRIDSAPRPNSAAAAAAAWRILSPPSTLIFTSAKAASRASVSIKMLVESDVTHLLKSLFPLFSDETAPAENWESWLLTTLIGDSPYPIWLSMVWMEEHRHDFKVGAF